MPSTASGDRRSAAGSTPGTGRPHGGSTWTAGSSWRPSPNTSKRRRPPPRQTCAPSSRSTRSGRWRWAGNCSPPSALRRRPKRHTRPLCTRSSVPTAAPSCGVSKTPQGPRPPRAETRNTPPGAREATPSGPPRPTRHTRALPTAADHRQCTIPTEGIGGALRRICDDTTPRTRGMNLGRATHG